MDIWPKNELRQLYSFIKNYKEICHTYNRSLRDNILIIKSRQRIRSLEKMVAEECSWKYRWDNFEQRYCKEVYNTCFDELQCKQYIENATITITAPYITGAWFTSSIVIFPIPALNKTVVYHLQSLDV